MDGLLFSPDGSSVLVDGRCEIDLLDAQSGKGLRRFSEPLIDRHQQCLSNPHFTPDGNYLLLQSSQPALIIYQTTTWQRVAAVPGMPDGALAYFPAPQSRRSVYLTATGEIALWNIPEKRKIATLDDNGRIIRTSPWWLRQLSTVRASDLLECIACGFGMRTMGPWCMSYDPLSRRPKRLRVCSGGLMGSMFLRRPNPTTSSRIAMLAFGAWPPGDTAPPWLAVGPTSQGSPFLATGGCSKGVGTA
jgi:WD40 repeat protein